MQILHNETKSFNKHFLKRIFQCKRKSNRILSLNFINGQYTLYSSALALNQTLKEKEKARQRKNKTKNKK